MFSTLFSFLFGTAKADSSREVVLKLGLSFEVNLGQFTRNLQQVIAWTNKPRTRIDLNGSLIRDVLSRSAAPFNGDQLYRVEGDYIVWMPDAYCKDVYQEILSGALKKRGRRK